MSVPGVGHLAWMPLDAGGVGSHVDYVERLRKLALQDPTLLREFVSGNRDARQFEPRVLALVRLAALVAVGGSVVSYGVQTDAALDAGATPDEIVEVLVSVATVVGVPRVVAAAPTLSVALGYDMDEALEP